MDNWSFEAEKRPDWPLDEHGEKIPPAFLEHIPGSPIDVEMELGLLAAYGIPAVCTYPNDGSFSKLIMGSAAFGADIFVPNTLLDDARNILSGFPLSDTEEIK